MPLSPGFESRHAHLSLPGCFTCLLSLQGVQWIQELVVVRVNWPGHPGLKKKKKLQQQLAIEDRTYYHVQFAK
jgi:hypothetical protein